MKKSVILMIAIIYIIAIVLVGFLGLKMKVYNEKKYVESIECISEDYVVNENKINPDDFDGSIKKTYRKGLKIELVCRVLPENADNKKLKYIYDEENAPFIITENEDGTAVVEFIRGGSGKVIVKATDNKGVQLIIQINAQIRPF